MPENLQQDFLNDYVKKVEELNFIEYNERTAKQNVLSPYKLMVVVANKWKTKTRVETGEIKKVQSFKKFNGFMEFELFELLAHHQSVWRF